MVILKTQYKTLNQSHLWYIYYLLIIKFQGTYNKLGEWPRVSNGPDMNHLIMGHEGNYGIITEAVLRIRNIPEVKEYSSFIFPNFEVGIKFMDEVARKRIWPASMRVVDNE